MIRDQEIDRLVNYTKGLGLKITFSSKKSECSAMWYLDNSGIVIFKSQNTTKIDTVLSLIHEIGHALHSIHEKDREVDTRFEAALDHIDEAEESGTDSKKRQRKVVLDSEIAGTRYWHQIYKETDMKFPLWKLEAQMEFDIYQYQVFYETGELPTVKERRKRFKEIVEKHKND